MKYTRLAVIALVAGTTATGGVATAAILNGAALAKDPKVSLAVARQTALKSRPGKITDQELEKDKRGSGLR